MANLKLFGSIFMALVWICNGLIINFFQLLLRLILRPLNPELFRKINYYLIYTSWSQLVAIAERWADCKVTLHYADEESRKHFGQEHCLTVMNHRYEVDWLYCWIVMDKFGCLASSKAYSKKSLRWVPVIGWSFYFAELIFLERNRSKDLLSMAESLDNLKLYKEYINLLLFSEGTRFTPEKYNNSVEFAKERGLQVYKHHLVPRTRGFNFTVKHMKDKFTAIYNIQIDFASDQNASQPTMTNMLKARSMHGHMYVQRIPIENIPTEDDEKLNEFLFELYAQKDQLTEYFRQHAEYPAKIRVTPKPRLAPLLNMIFWLITIITCQLSFIYALFVFKLYTLLGAIILGCLLFGVGLLLFMVRSSKSLKGSSYGIKPKESDVVQSEFISEAQTTDSVSSERLRQRKTHSS